MLQKNVQFSCCTMQPLKHVFSCNMHQSIPAVPISPPPWGNHATFAHAVSSGGGALANFIAARGWALAYPGANPGILTHMYSMEG